MTTLATPLEDALLADPIDVPHAATLLRRAGETAAPPGLVLLERCFAHPSPALRAAAYASLRGSRSLPALQTLARGLDDPNDSVVAAAAETILDNEEYAPQAVVAFHARGAARRAAARKAASLTLVHLLLADDVARGDAIDRLRREQAIGDLAPRSQILRQFLTEETLPVDDAARLFQDVPDLLALLAMMIARTGELPRSVFAILDRVPGGWLGLLRHREILVGERSPGEAQGAWLNVTQAAVEHHAATAWHAEALIVESTTHGTLLLEPKVPLDVRRAALRQACGVTGGENAKAFQWTTPFVRRAFADAAAQRDSGVHDLRAAYALADVVANGQPLRAMETFLGKAAIVRAAAEGAEDLAEIIGRSALRQRDHAVAMDWLQAIARAAPAAFVDVTRTLAKPYWSPVVRNFGFAELDGLLGALAASDVPAALWSTWTAAVTGTGPSTTALLESRGYRILRTRVSEEQQLEADALGVPAMIDHAATGIVFILIPGGEYLMGGRADDPESYPREKPARVVNVDAFYLAISPVTQSQWALGGGPELKFRDALSVPARGVSWSDAASFSAKHGLRLPREAEWERAARAGTSGRYWWGDDFRKGMVNCQDALPKAEPTPIGQFPANPWGLLDILGNVWEWCEEWFEPQRTRVLRGGCWSHERWNCRASERFWKGAGDDDEVGICGLRPAVDLSICFEATEPPSAPASP
jgi:formylglycine-generating enzyme required for sulfatase activity